MSSKDPIVAAAHELLDLFARKPPSERFDYWVKLGVVDHDGKLTRPFGGTAEADTHSLVTASYLTEPIDRLVWVLRNGNDTICLDSSTAARLLGAPSVSKLAALLHEADARGIVERWTTADGLPVSVDARKHENAAIGARLTAYGKQLARDLETKFDSNMPLEGVIP